MSKHVIVAINDSDVSHQAFEYAVTEYPDATITAVHVIEAATPFLSLGFSVDGYDEIPTREREAAEALLEQIRQTAAVHGTEVRTDVQTGNVPNRIAEYVDRNDADHLVLGSRGRTRLSRLLLGSVAEDLVRCSPVPLTVVRESHDGPGGGRTAE